MQTLVVIPTYQEAGNIGELLAGLRSVVPEATALVVDDGSSDGTALVAEGVGRELGGVEVLQRGFKDGLGNAYHEGFRWGLARDFDVIVTMDADLSHDPHSLPLLLRAVEEGADLAIGSRYIPGGSIPDWPWYRRFLSRYGNVYARRALCLGFRDTTSGYRAYRADVLRALDLAGLHAAGYGALIEMAYRLSLTGAEVAEVPITFGERSSGDSKMSLGSAFETFRLVTALGLRRRLAPRQPETVA
jgi:dolichol-phosphate mannosyltransferase